MKRFVLSLALVAASAVTALAQDPVKAFPTQYKVVLENARVRVLHAAVAKGAKNTLHDHPDHVAVVLTDSSIRFTGPDGKASDVTEKKGDALYVGAGKHAGENIGAAGLEAIIVELKGQPGTAVVPESRPGMSGVTTLVDNARVRVMRATADPTFAEPAGSKHDYDQVVIALGTGAFTLTVDGQTTSQWKLGDARFIGRGVAHESKNTGGKPVEFVVVSIK